jgi:TM2 domain-containing membrane protein YozV
MPAASRIGAAQPRGGIPLRKPQPRSLAFTYVLWCLGLLGVCGLQRIYNRKPFSGLLWLFSFGLCGLGQLVDLLLIPSLVEQANQPLLLDQALSRLEEREGPSLERQLLLLARRAGPQGFTINDALVELDLPSSIGSAEVSAEIERLLHAELLDVGNDQRGRVVYREP